jgi:hypothetical protein
MPKPTRAVKKTDKNKAWNRKAKSTNYQIETIPLRKSILIVCEGQTEKLYFESFPVLGLKVEAIDLGGQSKTKLVENTQKILEKSEYEYDEVWCVFDMDFKNGANEYADFDNAIEKANNTVIKATIESQNKAIDSQKVELAEKLQELEDWKNQSPEIKYKEVIKYREVKSNECEDIKAVINSMRGTSF